METPSNTDSPSLGAIPSLGKHITDSDCEPSAKRVKLAKEDPDAVSAQVDNSETTNTLPLPEITDQSQDTTSSGKKKKDRRGGHAHANTKSGEKNDTKEWVGKRRGTRSNNENTDSENKAPRLPKRLCALLIGFCGSGYSGMQMCVQPTKYKHIYATCMQWLMKTCIKR